MAKKAKLEQINMFLKTPQLPADEKQRLRELYSYGVLDTTYEEEFDDVVRLAANICNMPIAMVSLSDTERQWFKAKQGIDYAEIPRDISFCTHVITCNKDIFEVEDATKDDQFMDNPLVIAYPNIRHYVGVALVTKNGYKLGAISVMDNKAGELTVDQVFALQILAKQIVKLLDQRLLTRQLESQKTKAQQQMDLQNRILSIIAHDVRNPIHAVKSIIELSDRKMLSQEHANDLMQMAGKQIDGTLELLNNLIDWGSMQIRGRGFETEKVHLRTLVSNMFKSFEVIASLKANIMVNLVDEDLFIRSDINALRFILRNLISNANKFTKEGVVTVYAHRNDEEIMVSVSDTGLGMPEEIREKLFDSEKYQSTTGTSNEKGSGLGLILTKDFVEAFKGNITVESAPGKGTSVQMLFPVT